MHLTRRVSLLLLLPLVVDADPMNRQIDGSILYLVPLFLRRPPNNPFLPTPLSETCYHSQRLPSGGLLSVLLSSTIANTGAHEHPNAQTLQNSTPKMMTVSRIPLGRRCAALVGATPLLHGG
jgi:hypothetical protein